MKTSKIIFISLLGTITIIILAAMINAKMHSQPIDNSRTVYRSTKQAVPSFKVLYLKNSKVRIVPGDSSYFVIGHPKDSIAPKLNYSMNGDTLILSDLNELNRSVIGDVDVHSSGLLNKVRLKNSEVTVYNFNLKNLSIDMDHSTAWFNKYQGEKSSFDALDILAKNHSHINISWIQVDSVHIVLQSSQAELFMAINKLKGSISEESHLSMRQPREISLKRDKSSMIFITKVDNK